jgi:putative nucleotidyltransferase with HDIG domain
MPDSLQSGLFLFFGVIPVKKFILQHLSIFGFGLAVLLLLGVGIYAVISLRAFTASNTEVDHTIAVLDKLDSTLILLLDAETGDRGYIITGDENFLKSYNIILSPENGIDQHLQDLRQLTIDNPSQQKRIDELTVLAAKKIAFMQDTITLRKYEGFEAAQKLALGDSGKETMDSIRQLITAMKNEETNLLKTRSDLSAVSLQKTIWVIAVGAGLTLLFLSLSFYLVNKEVRVRRQAEASLLVSNTELDQRLEQLDSAKGKIEQQLLRLDSLHAIDLAILGATDLHLALKTVLHEVSDRLGSDIAYVLLFNSDTLDLNAAAVTGNLSKKTRSLNLRLGDGTAGKAALERRTVISPDLTAVERSDSLHAAVVDEQLQTVAATPLIAKGIVVGVLTVGFRSVFTPDADWIDFFEALASQAAMAVDSGKSFADLQRSNLNLKLAYDTTIEGWSHALDLRDKETEGHTLRVTEMTLKLARLAGMTDAELVHVRRGALLHDIGKMGVPDTILLKPDKLTTAEWEIMRMHPTYANELISPIAYLHPALDIPYCHHEKWDGSGYPNGLKGEQIPLAARYFAVVDVWDALRSDRPYRKGWPEEKVLEYIRANSGSHFDPKAVEAFFEVLQEEKEETKANL